MSGTDFDGPPPEGWVIQTSKSTGLPYFFNPSTGVSTYSRPQPAATVVVLNWGSTNTYTNNNNDTGSNYSNSSNISLSTSLPPGWITQTSSKTGKVYYYNTQTGISSYEHPGGGGSNPAAIASSSSSGASFSTSSSISADDTTNPNKRFRPDTATHTFAVPSLPPFTPSLSSVTVSSVTSSSTTNSSSDSAVALKVASAYDHLQDRGREGRQASDILHLKNFNNWIKATLVQAFAPKPCTRVLDLACGKLGDLFKWKNAGVHYYCGIDISRQAVEDASVRFNDLSRNSSIKAKIIRADLGIIDLNTTGIFGSNEQFDAISIQFALHYLFQTEARILNFFRNIAGRLAPGGIFIGTIPDAAVLVRRLRDIDDEETSYGNTHYTIEFTPKSKEAQYALGNHPYGVKYNFYLAESVDHVDEYLVPYELLERLALSVGLVPLAKDNFHHWFHRLINGDSGTSTTTINNNNTVNTDIYGNPSLNITPTEAKALLKRMNVLDVEGTLSPEEWEVAGLYRIFAFRAPYPGEPVPSSTFTITSNTVFSSTNIKTATGTNIRAAPNGYDYKSHIEINDIVDLIG